MYKEVEILINRLKNLLDSGIISWGCPIVSFGDISKSRIATLGINPSNLEFIDTSGSELTGVKRRFPTLHSLEITDWLNVEEEHIEVILQWCNEYFQRNPYDNWFKRLDYIISGTSLSYYFPSSEACHLDLVPYATYDKWGNLSKADKSRLLESSIDILGSLLKDSPIDIIVLNGKSVVDHFGNLTDINYELEMMEDWELPRKNGGVRGISYKGKINSVGGVKLNKEIHVLGYNHNIQSSFGVTTKVQSSIREWITKETEDILCD